MALHLAVDIVIFNAVIVPSYSMTQGGVRIKIKWNWKKERIPSCWEHTNSNIQCIVMCADI